MNHVTGHMLFKVTINMAHALSKLLSGGGISLQKQLEKEMQLCFRQTKFNFCCELVLLGFLFNKTWEFMD